MDSVVKKKYEPQKLDYSGNALLVHAVDFPIYYVESISERHIVIAGGGGSSKTGVHNQLNILELVPTGHSCAADLVMKYNTPAEIPDAIMNGSLIRELPIVGTRLVTGGTQATLYRFRFDAVNKTFKVVDYEIMKDRRIKSEIKSVKSTGGGILTGCCDGQLISWDLTSDENRIDKIIAAHTKEIDEIDYDPTSQQIVTTSREEGRCAIWNSSSMKLIHEFKRNFINTNQGTSNLKFNFRSGRFAYDATTKSDKVGSTSCLLISCNPIPVKGPSKLFKWTTNNYNSDVSTTVTHDGVMAMTTSSDGKLVAIGTRSGTVLILDVVTLKALYKFEGAHLNAVTNLSFLEPKPESLTLTNSRLCPLLSVSIDRRVVLHRPQKGNLTSSLCYVLIAVLLIYFISMIHRSYI